VINDKLSLINYQLSVIIGKGKMQFKIPKFGFKFKKRGNAAGFFGAKLSIISNLLSIINDKLFPK